MIMFSCGWMEVFLIFYLVVENIQCLCPLPSFSPNIFLTYYVKANFMEVGTVNLAYLK